MGVHMLREGGAKCQTRWEAEEAAQGLHHYGDEGDVLPPVELLTFLL